MPAFAPHAVILPNFSNFEEPVRKNKKRNQKSVSNKFQNILKRFKMQELIAGGRREVPVLLAFW